MARMYTIHEETAKLDGGFLMVRRYDPATETYFWCGQLTEREAATATVYVLDALQDRVKILEARLAALDPAWDL